MRGHDGTSRGISGWGRQTSGAARRTSVRRRRSPRRRAAFVAEQAGLVVDGRAGRRRARRRTARLSPSAQVAGVDRQSAIGAASASRQRSSLRTTWSRSGPGRSSYSVTEPISTQPPPHCADPLEPVVHDRAQAGQAARLRQRGDQHRIAEAGGGGFEHGQLQVLARTEMGEHAALGHADRLRQRTDRQALEAGEPGDLVGPVDDRFAGRGAFGGGGQSVHERDTLARPFVL